MSGIGTEIGIIILLLILNGIFAMSELAVVTARRVRLEARADEGDAGARAALSLAHEPSQFLSTVQVGITLIGVMAGAFGGATIAEQLAAGFGQVPAIAQYADALALGTVVAAITFMSLILGELVPKRIALGNPEKVASLVARPMRMLSKAVAPLVMLLTGTTNFILRLFGMSMTRDVGVTEEEIRAMVEQGAETGAVQGAEHEMVEGVFRLGDRLVSDVMTPRTQLEWVDIGSPVEEAKARIADAARLVFLVCDGTVDQVVGIVHAEDIVSRCLRGEVFELRPLINEPLYVPASMPALGLLEQFRQTRRHAAVALDEYGGLSGLVLLEDLVEFVVGAIPRPDEPVERDITRRDERTWTIVGATPLEDVEVALDLDGIPEASRGVRTIGGLVMAKLGRVPKVGDAVEIGGARFEVSEMEDRRIASVQVTKSAAATRAPGGH
ncbi:MAG: hemolysin family protein [Gemmatimonadota bacterium]